MAAGNGASAAPSKPKTDPVYHVVRFDAPGSDTFHIVRKDVMAKTQEAACDAVTDTLEASDVNGFEFGAFLARGLVRGFEYEHTLTPVKRKKGAGEASFSPPAADARDPERGKQSQSHPAAPEHVPA